MDKIKPSDLQAEAQQLIAAGKMPKPAQLLAAVANAREKYADKIVAARKQPDSTAAGAEALKN